MKTVFFNLPAHGHINPTLPLVRELVRRGEQVIYYNAEEFRAKISATGAEFRPYPAFANPAEISAASDDSKVFKTAVLLHRVSERLIPFALAELEREQPDYVMHDSLCLWGRVAAAVKRLPTVVTIGTFAFGARMPNLGNLMREFGRNLPELAQVLQLDAQLRRRYPHASRPGDHAFNNTGDLHIVFTSREFQFGGDQFDDRYKFVGASFAPRAGDSDFPFDQLTRKPLVYVALGTIMNTRASIYQTAVEAFRDFDGQVVIAAGQSAAQLTDLPPHFIVREFVPQLQILEHADLFITHSGMNSVTESLYYGVPMVNVPQQFEQALVAERVRAVGAGITLGVEPPYGDFSADDLRAASERVLSEAQYRDWARIMGDTLRTGGGYLRAADEIQWFARWTNGAKPQPERGPLRFEFIPYPLWRRAGLPAPLKRIIRPFTAADADANPPDSPAELAHYLTRWGLLPAHMDAPAAKRAIEAANLPIATADASAQSAPSAVTLRLPAQWEPLEAVILSFPVLYPSMWTAHLEMIEAISQVARADVLIPAPGWAAAIRMLLIERGQADLSRVCLLHLPTDDVWVRDYGPIVGLDAHGQRVTVSAVYDPLPTYPQTRDNAMPERWSAHNHIPVRVTDVHTEGGNLWSDGAGTLIMSDDLYARNPHLTPAEIERQLHTLFEFDKLIITPSLRLEETGHVDLLCKLTDARTVLVGAPTVPLNGERLRETAAVFRRETNAAGEPYRVFELPTPRLYVNWGVYPVWRSYTNALTVNGRVLVPVFGIPEDADALRVYAQALPDHQIIPINCAGTVNGGGAVHCLTKEVPAAQ